MLEAPISGRPFLLCVRAMEHTLLALLAQTNVKGLEQAICYLSRTMISVEYRYTLIEKSV